MKSTIKFGIAILVILMIFFLISVFAQNRADDPQKVKDAMVNYVLYSQDLEKANKQLTDLLNKFGADVKAVKTIAQLDSVKKVYGIAEPEKMEKPKGK